MTRQEELSREIDLIDITMPKQNIGGVDMYLDLRYNIYLTRKEVIRSIEILYEVLGDRFETLEDLWAEGTVEDNYQFAIKVCDKLLDEGLIYQGTYEEAIKQLEIFYQD